MVVSGIADDEEDEFINMPSANELKNGDNLQCYVEVVPGIYQVEIYSYAPGDLSTGWGQITGSSLFKPAHGIELESIKDYFLRTQKLAEMPAWIGYEITEDSEKRSEFYQAAVEEKYIDFIIRLSPVIEDLPVVEIGDDSSVNWEFRKPEKCPLGIVGMKD